MDDVIDNRSCPKNLSNGWRDIVRICYLPTAYQCIVLQEGLVVMSNLRRAGIFPFLINGNKPYSFKDAGSLRSEASGSEREAFITQQQSFLIVSRASWLCLVPTSCGLPRGEADAGRPRWMPTSTMNQGAREDAGHYRELMVSRSKPALCPGVVTASQSFSLPKQSWEVTPVKRFQSLRVLADRVKNLRGCSGPGWVGVLS